MRRYRTASVLTCAAAFGLILTAPHAASAFPAGPPDQAPDSFFVIDEVVTGEINVGAPGDRLVVEYDPGAGPIDKLFNINSERNDDGSLDVQDLNEIVAGAGIYVYEYWEVGPGSPPWRDWHEDILTPDWEWGYGQFLANGVPVGFVNYNGASISFDFPPLVPGTQVDIVKVLVYTGSGTDPGFLSDFWNETLSVQVLEYPSVPEPTTFGLAAIGAVMLVGRGRRKTRR